ncbi:insulin-degrading enzyme-like 1, peroxisomal isoform X6 [Rosa rugosa]|uniref:insulin-degrading enzyme-like 1, peroxisomal isoform X6 n=1 Tax=Rosa rugosa TaxID=74645 RepID=UPI002B40BDFA|nr:insulin-degrading enzyme-like 1, peroxisomal isoform X6 [Rosa rugosa]
MLKRKASRKKMFSPIISGTSPSRPSPTIIQAVVIRSGRPISSPRLTQISKQAEETTVVIHLRLRHRVSSQTYSLNANLCHLRLYQVHRDDFMLNVKLRLFVLIAKQPAFHQLRSVEQLGYLTAPSSCHLLLQRNDCGIRGLQFIIQSAVKGPGHIDLRVEEFLKTFESKLYEMTNDKFKVRSTRIWSSFLYHI